jgi:CubicO group peptidase (beta-lactamase class C family)
VPVSDRTLFEIGSLSKAFTAAALAILVDDGKLKWDDAVIDYLPGCMRSRVARGFTIRIYGPQAVCRSVPATDVPG